MLDICPMKDDVVQNKWFQWTNKQITHLQTTHDEDDNVINYASVVIDSDAIVASARSVRSAKKQIEWTSNVSHSIKK